MCPQGGEYFISVESVLELLVELVGSASDGNAAVEENESVGQVLECNSIISEDFMDEPGFVVVEEEEE